LVLGHAHYGWPEHLSRGILPPTPTVRAQLKHLWMFVRWTVVGSTVELVELGVFPAIQRGHSRRDCVVLLALRSPLAAGTVPITPLVVVMQTIRCPQSTVCMVPGAVRSVALGVCFCHSLAGEPLLNSKRVGVLNADPYDLAQVFDLRLESRNFTVALGNHVFESI
jgi:hypothetical protein